MKNVTNPQAHEAWKRRKKEFNSNDTDSRTRQFQWRKDCLVSRAHRRVLTDKNRAEAQRLGIVLNENFGGAGITLTVS
jgi:hypothetical protein